jgi:hypothetical protein
VIRLRRDHQASYPNKRRKELTARPQQHETALPLAETESVKSSVAWACVVYSLVPYLGILFIPFAVVFGTAELIRPRTVNASSRVLPLVTLVPIVGAQLLLWWLLYLIPEIGI